MYQRILTVQDISCVGQCSLTVALPVLSACGLEAAILPTGILSTHTSGFQGYTFLDTTEEMEKIAAHWKKEGLTFEAAVTGYLGSARQVDVVKDIFNTCLTDGAIKLVDPAMADNGKLYPGFDASFVDAMRELVRAADMILPNITEACLLADMPYRETPDEAFINELADKLLALGPKTVVLTGCAVEEGKLGILTASEEKKTLYLHEKMEKSYHGTGDIYTAAFAAAYLSGKTAEEAAALAGDFIVDCIKNTMDKPEHWYGVAFEPLLKKLAEEVL